MDLRFGPVRAYTSINAEVSRESRTSKGLELARFRYPGAAVVASTVGVFDYLRLAFQLGHFQKTILEALSL
jgi:hypothetical protein